MHLDDEAVRADGRRGHRKRLHKPVDAARVARIDDDRQVREALQNRHSRNIKRVARERLIRADAALAEDDALVAAGHDVLGAHQKLLDRVREAAL